MTITTPPLIRARQQLAVERTEDKLFINLFGGLSAFYNGQQLGIGRKQGALLAYLALTHEGKVSRDRLVGLLWSRHARSNAKGNLRQMLKNLRDLLNAAGFQGLETCDSQQLCLRPDSVSVDVREAISATASLELPEYLLETKNIHNTLLEDFEGIDPEYDNWIILQRHTFRDRLSLHLENALSDSKISHTRNFASALHNIDSSNEVAVRTLMKTYARENNYAGALRVYEELVVLLDHEYGMDPTTETQDLAVDIKLAESTPEGLALNEVYSEPVTMNAVAPDLLIEKFNTDLIPEDKVYVANGFRHDLLASLVRFRDWRVIEQSLQTDASDSDGTSGKRYLLRAQAYMDGSELRLVFTVIDTGNGAIIWSHMYALRMESWLVTQKQILRKLAVALNINISADRLNNISRNRELPAALHDRWLLGQYHLFRWNPKSSATAERIFKSLSLEAPNFAPAFSSLVQIENSRHLMFPGKHRRPPNDVSTIDLARQAVQIDPVDSKTHLSLAWTLCLSCQFDEALRYFDSANELNENDPWTVVSTAQGYAFCAEYTRAESLVIEANELGLSFNQLYFAYQVGTMFLYGDYRGAVAAADNAGDIISNIRAWKCAALAQTNRLDAAIEEGEQFLSLNRANWHGKKTHPSDEDIVGWFLQCFPIRRSQAWNTLRDGLAKAQLPIPASAAHIQSGA